MSLAVLTPLRFQVGARTLAAVPRRLQRVALGLAEVLAGTPPVLPPLDRDAHGYLITSLPAEHEAALAGGGRTIAFVRQRYTRYYADLRLGHDAWWAGLSANTRSGLKRKGKRIGAHRVESFRTPDEVAAFHAVARRIAERTYQERLLGAGLPDTPEFLATMTRDAAAGRVRAWLLFVEEQPAAYLYCPVRGGTAVYEYVGHDPAFSELSPGAVLHWAAMRELYGDGDLDWFDFTEGEGQHKRSLATGGIACMDLLLLRPTLANRAAVAALKGFDAAVGWAKARVGQSDLVRKLRRG